MDQPAWHPHMVLLNAVALYTRLQNCHRVHPVVAFVPIELRPFCFDFMQICFFMYSLFYWLLKMYKARRNNLAISTMTLTRNRSCWYLSLVCASSQSELDTHVNVDFWQWLHICLTGGGGSRHQELQLHHEQCHRIWRSTVCTGECIQCCTFLLSHRKCG